MRKINQLINGQLLKGILLISLLWGYSLQAQLATNLTNFLGVQHLQTQNNPNFSTIRSTLASNGSDCFLLTFNLASATVSSDMDILRFNPSNTQNAYHFKIGILANKVGWFVDRKHNGSWLRYRIYDDIGYSGNFTVVVGKDFVGMAHDESAGKWKFAPVFFGINSNTGYLGSTLPMDTYITNTSYSNPRVMRQGALDSQGKQISVYRYDDNGNGNVAAGATTFHLLINRMKDASGQSNTTNPRLKGPGDQELTASSMLLYPNPTNDEVSLKFMGTEAGVADMWIYDQLGKLCLNTSFKLKEGEGIYRFSASENHLAEGMYQLVVRTPNGNFVEKLVVR